MRILHEALIVWDAPFASTTINLHVAFNMDPISVEVEEVSPENGTKLIWDSIKSRASDTDWGWPERERRQKETKKSKTT